MTLRGAKGLAAVAHALFVIALASAGGMTAAKALVCAAWIAIAFFEQRRGGGNTAHWTAPCLALGWLGLAPLVLLASDTTWLGAPALVAGLLLRAGAIAALGPAYSDGIEPTGAIVDRGVYRHLDHPGELGALLIATGSAAMVTSATPLLWVVATLLPLTYYRMRLEDAALARAQGHPEAAARCSAANAAMPSPVASVPST